MKITMVISTYNRGDLLNRSFARLAHLTVPDEILVIDDGGSDSTEDVCDHWAERLPVTYVYNHNPGPTICSMARNIGVRKATHDWIITSEPELIYMTDIVAQMKDAHLAHPTEIVSAGSVYFEPEGWDLATGLELELELAGDYTPPSDWEDAIGWVAPYTALWKKEWLVELGGWDENFPGSWGWDDVDLLTRLRINGHGQYIDLSMKALHQFHGLGGDRDQVNERYWLNKSFHGDETNTADLVANKDHVWGVHCGRGQ